MDNYMLGPRFSNEMSAAAYLFTFQGNSTIYIVSLERKRGPIYMRTVWRYSNRVRVFEELPDLDQIVNNFQTDEKLFASFDALRVENLEENVFGEMGAKELLSGELIEKYLREYTLSESLSDGYINLN